MFDSSWPSFLCCDASDKGVGPESSHDVAQKEIVWCDSRVLTPKLKRIIPTSSGRLCPLSLIKRFASYLSGKHFTVITDHRPLKYISLTHRLL